MNRSATFKRALPVVVSGATLAWVLLRFDVARVVETVGLRAGLVLGPALLVYGAVTLALESLSIRSLVPQAPPGFDRWTTARIKCASYLLATINYTLGGATLAVLLARRASLGLGEAAGVVLLVSGADLLLLLCLGVGATALAAPGAPMLELGVGATAALGLLVGSILVRSRAPLGPLERVRSLSLFEALRRTPVERLAYLALLRLLFCGCFIAIGAATFAAFEVQVAVQRLVAGMAILAVVGALPIAVAGLGTGQVASVYVFRGVAPPETLIALSLALSAGLIALRVGLGLAFARELTREALVEARGERA